MENTLKYLLLTFALLFVANIKVFAEERAVQHKVVADITTVDEAKRVFLDTTEQIRSKTQFNQQALHDIHFITYSLEKSVAFYVENLEGKGRQIAKKMAVVVEHIHINSENNRKRETKEHLKNYFQLAAALKTYI